MKHQTQVIKGKGRGKNLGIPTINAKIPDPFPYKHGIYAGWIYNDTKKYPAAIHFGPRPVFDESDVSLEAHILETIPESINDSIMIELLHFIRDIKTFSDPAKMVAEIARDVRKITKLLDLEINS